jgi:hypothetical protein
MFTTYDIYTGSIYTNPESLKFIGVMVAKMQLMPSALPAPCKILDEIFLI